ncbi:hypothetical protein EPUS_04117 [Endocarpon pusillum Z07020]|uniref:F-box domain-containing protein n=1 Tax=Endocarpon pusillum (strain Z07020 / HMAS-L-300199) TaxID=1263415 RepID=U1HVU4_ENDPU|nr:uncharacterized protein EPUS_04117 [Endocarpon pusillum Z07020]ERF73494.1 hypothetical protein EPUS_04117 [Endocarpon pusillum Z07020]
MKNIRGLPNEIILQIFVHAGFPADTLALAGTCKHFRGLLERNERSLSNDIAARVVGVPYKVLGFGGRIPSFQGVMRLVHEAAEIGAVVDCCNDIRHLPQVDEHAIWRAVWFIPLWDEYLHVGLLLYKMISQSTSPMERLGQLRGGFHALLRFTSIVMWDMIHIRFALTFGKGAIRRMRYLVQFGEATGDTAPWLQNDVGWRRTEISLFEHGGARFLELLNRTNQGDWIRRHQPPGDLGECVLNMSRLGKLPPDRCYHLRLDDLCLAYGGVWGPPDFWRQFDPFGLKDSGLCGVEAMWETVQHLPD